MRPLLQRYESPTGSFDPDDAELVALAVTSFQQLMGETDIVARISELLSDVIEPITDVQRPGPEQPDTGSDDPFQLSLSANGYLVATRICPGWTLPPAVDTGNGTARVTATFSEEGLDPVVWGTVSACRYRVEARRIELQPSSERDALHVYWGAAAGRSTLSVLGAIFSLALRADVEGVGLDLDLDVRLAENEALEYLLPLGGGSVVVRANADGSFGVRSVEGSFECDDSFSCVSSGAAGEP